jgi:hypothetical protein
MIRIALVAVLAVVLIGSVYFGARREPAEPPAVPQSHVGVAAQPSDVSVNGVAEDAEPTSVALLDLHAMSETFRHSTLLVAIRDAGFVCDDVVAASRTGEGLWIASCRDMRGYKITASGSEALVVEPIAHYFDNVDPRRQILNDHFRLDRR